MLQQVISSVVLTLPEMFSHIFHLQHEFLLMLQIVIFSLRLLCLDGS
jgi:hypothetical protein